MKKERGLSKIYNNGQIQITQWHDNNTVSVISTFGTETVSKTKRFVRKLGKYQNVDIPSIIKLYNSSMGGVDLFDQCVSTYRSKIRIKNGTGQSSYISLMQVYQTVGKFSGILKTRFLCWSLDEK